MSGVIQVPAAPSRGVSAQAPDHSREGRVEAQLEGALAQAAPQAACHVKARGLDHHARIGGEPEDRRLLVPRKDAERVGEQEPLARQVAADGEQAGGLRMRRRREGQIGAQAVDGHGGRVSAGSGGGGMMPHPLPRPQEPA